MLNVILIVLLYKTECLHILNTLLQLYAKCPFSQKKKYIYIYKYIYACKVSFQLYFNKGWILSHFNFSQVSLKI